MRLLIDTSVWIDFFNGKAYTQPIQEYLLSGLIYSHELIEGELRIGNLPSKRTEILKEFALLPRLRTISWQEIFNLIEIEKLFGSGISLIDVQLYAAVKVHNIHFWTRDKNLKSLCQKNNVLLWD